MKRYEIMKQVDGKDLSAEQRAKNMVKALVAHFNEGSLTKEKLDKYFNKWKEHFEKEVSQEEYEQYRPHFINN